MGEHAFWFGVVAGWASLVAFVLIVIWTDE